MKRWKIEEIRVSSRGNVYAQYCEYNPKMEGYNTRCRYTRVSRNSARRLEI